MILCFLIFTSHTLLETVASSYSVLAWWLSG